MANQKHIDILKQGVKKWNQWRAENPDIEPDLSEYSFTGKMILNEPQINLKNANLKKVNLAGSRFRLANLLNADLSEANLKKSNLSGAFLMQANLSGANLGGAILQGANISEAIMDKVVLTGANLSQGEFMGHEFYFEKTIFEVPRWRRGSYFFQQTRKTILSNATLSKSDLRGADFSNADLMGASLRDANLYGTTLRGANLREVDLDGACLYETNLNSANLDDVNFGHSKLKSTFILNVDLSKSKGLDKVRHDGPSTISLDTLFRSRGNIPASFFQGTGVPDSFIAFLESLSPDEFDYHSCFISFSSLDQEFVQKLHLDLQQEGVRTWLVPIDKKTGGPIQPRIDQEIQSNDKLLLVFSKNSVKSDWIEFEVKQAIEQERKIYADMEDDELPIPVLIPLVIDSSINETDHTWAKKIREDRDIENFTEWQNKTSYRSAFDRLLKDLKSTSQPE
jgi:uncharacterized protein YjbI with pentapeptide repeats